MLFTLSVYVLIFNIYSFSKLVLTSKFGGKEDQ